MVDIKKCEHKVQDKLQSNEQNVRKESLPCTSENVCRLLIDSQISCNFRVLGSQLGLDPPDLDIIEHYPIEQHLIKIICLCFQRGQLTWSGIIQTLKKPSLKLYSSANYIESRVQAEPLISETHAHEFSISNVVNEVAGVQRFRDFAWNLPGLSLEDVNTILENYSKDEHHQRLVELWFKRDTHPSWEKLKRVLNNHRCPSVLNYICNILSIWRTYIVAILPTHKSKFISSVQYTKEHQDYRDYMKSLYCTQIPTQLPPEVCFSQWPPTLTHKVFKLAMIKGEKIQRGEVEDEFVRLTITGKVDDILLKKTPINLEDIFKDDKDTLGKRKVILLEGAPGSGKSTLSLHICQQWGENKLFTQYFLLVLVHLRDPSIQKAKNIAELLCVECGHQCDKIREGISRRICATHGEGVLFILDGWDELPAKIKQESIFIKLIHGKTSNIESFLHLSSIIITSRPVSSGDLHSFVSARIEILGFSHDELQQFVRSCLPDSADNLLRLIKDNHALADICSIPLNASILVHLFKCGRSTLPNSHHDIFHELILCFIYHHYMKCTCNQDKMLSSSFESLDNLPIKTDQYLHRLCELAYKGVLTDTVTFGHLPLNFNTLGLLQGTEVYLKRGKTTFYNFFHLSIQEYLATRYIVKHLSHSEQLQTLNKLTTNPRFCGIIHFFSAMTKLNTPGINDVILKFARNYTIETPQNFVTLLHCLFEAKNESVCNLIAEQLRHELNLSNITLNAASCQCLSYFLSFVHEYELSLRGCSIGNEGCNILFKCEKLYCLKSLSLSHNKISDEGVLALSSALTRMTNLQKIDLSHNNISDDGIIAVSTAIKGMTRLQEIILYSNNISDKGTIAISDAIKHKKSLTRLYLSHNKIGFQGAAAISSALKATPRLQELYLSGNHIGSDGAKAIANAVKKSMLQVLGLSKNKIGDDGAVSISQVLQMTSLQMLYLSSNDITAEGEHAITGVAKTLKDLCVIGLETGVS